MRNIFIDTLFDIAKVDENVQLITGDLGFGVLTKFWEELPDQFINVGIAEQNMASVAAGLGMNGGNVYTYSIGNFPTLRCLEQIRNDICYHNSNVTIVAVGGGFAYGALGMSHHATEDLAIMRALPEMTVFSPSDPVEVVEVTKAAYSIPGPCYIRLGKGGEPTIHTKPIAFKVGEALKIRSGKDIAILSTGGITAEAKKAAELLATRGINAALYSFPTIKPIDTKTINLLAENVKMVITVEEHNVIGGLGGAVAEVLAETLRNNTVLLRIGLGDTYTSKVGSQAYLRVAYGLDAEHIVEKILNRYNEIN